jgi:hypothetical protein
MIGLVMLLAVQSATFLEGNELYDLCTGDKAAQLQCLRYVEGAADGLAVAQWSDKRTAPTVCIPTKATLKKLAEVTVKHMKKHPAGRDGQASLIVWAAFKAAYPCPK